MKQIKSRFFEYLLETNKPHMDGFTRWVFHAGMEFNSIHKWWGDKKKRSVTHEGIDLCYFEDAGGRLVKIHKDIKIPATFAGKIVKMEKDFLGKSIYIRHDIFSEQGKQLYTIYGHTAPFAPIETGKRVAEGENIAVISDRAKNPAILPHLHITFAWISSGVETEYLNWGNIGSNQKISLVDPLSIL